jgi:hypothetical protein
MPMSAAQAAHAADHDDDEGRDEDFGIHSRIQAEYRGSRDTAESGERHSESENPREQRRDIGPQASGHDRVVDTGSYHGADPAALQKQPQQQRDRDAKADQKQPVRGEHAKSDLHRAL